MPAPSRRSGVEAVAAGSKIGVAQSKSAGFSRKIRRQPGCNRSLRTTSTSQRAKTTLFRLSLAVLDQPAVGDGVAGMVNHGFAFVQAADNLVGETAAHADRYGAQLRRRSIDEKRRPAFL